MGKLRLRLLCLHGSRQDAEIFSQRIQALKKKIDPLAELVFLDAPHTLPLDPGQEVPMRCWYVRDGGPPPPPASAMARAGAGPTASSLDGAGLPGATESFARIRAAWLEQGPFDGVLGFSQGAAVAAAMAFLQHHSGGGGGDGFPGLRFAIMAGGYASPTLKLAEHMGVAPGGVAVASLHTIGARDAAVPPGDSRELAALFRDPQVYEHGQSHCVPQRGADVPHFTSFLKAMLLQPRGGEGPGGAGGGGGGGAGGDWEPSEEQLEELEAIEAIFMEDYELLAERPPRLRVKLGLDSFEAWPPDRARPSSLVFTFTKEYPSEMPLVEVVSTGMKGQGVPPAMVEAVRAAGEEGLGGPLVFSMVSCAQEWAASNPPAADAPEMPPSAGEGGGAEEAGAGAGEEEEEAGGMAAGWDEELPEDVVDEMVSAASKHAAGGPPIENSKFNSGGKWSYVVGLVGKPSAGKSTFFNAASQPEEEEKAAAMGAHPFTTIEPNVAHACFATPCPCHGLGLADKCEPLHGHTASGERRLPVLLKDVAGLVPGAYMGRGRGNKFLDDLVDADVLIHVVDASGRTGRDGNASADGGDPLDDIGWVREELHRWIFSNISFKWQVIRRRPTKLLEMFSGYHASNPMVWAALTRAGVDPMDLTGLPKWGPDVLHRIVANFLRVRFPVLLALNKADTPGAGAHIARVREALPDEAVVPVSARCELALQSLRKRGWVEYSDGDPSFDLLSSPGGEEEAKEAKVLEEAARIREHGMGGGAGTGVLRALSRAVCLRPPVLVHPVGDLDDCTACVPARRGERPPVLRDAIVLRPGSTATDLYDAMKNPPYSMVEGDFVRAECRDLAEGGGRRRLLRKEEALCFESSVVRVMTNRKVSWQAKGGAR